MITIPIDCNRRGNLVVMASWIFSVRRRRITNGHGPNGATISMSAASNGAGGNVNGQPSGSRTSSNAYNGPNGAP